MCLKLHSFFCSWIVDGMQVFMGVEEFGFLLFSSNSLVSHKIFSESFDITVCFWNKAEVSFTQYPIVLEALQIRDCCGVRTMFLLNINQHKVAVASFTPQEQTLFEFSNRVIYISNFFG